MILRVVRELVREEHAEAYEAIVRESVRHHLVGRAGLVDHWIGRPVGGGREWVVTSLWTDLDAVRAFAGTDPSQIVLNDRQREMLEASWVHHYEVVAD